MDETGTLEVRAFRIGSIGFTTGTYEMFSTHSLYVKEHSPFDITFIIAGNFTYLPDEAAYNYRSYEADTGYYARGSGEKLAENYVKMLEEIKYHIGCCRFRSALSLSKFQATSKNSFLMIWARDFDPN